MQLIQTAKSVLTDVRAHWRTPAPGNYVAYKEYMMLAVGWMGMRLATTFGITFAVGNGLTAMTLHMTNRDLLIMGYICTAIGYALAPLNSYILENLRSRAGKYRVYAKLAIPASLLSLFALFFPYEKVGYVRMVVSLFIIGQIQGYVQNWFITGVSNLVFVISPNSEERVRVMTVTSVVHNFAPSLTDILIPVFSDVLADGDLYNIRTYRMIYPAIIIVGMLLSVCAYKGVSERIVQPRTRMTNIGFVESFRAVAGNRLFWIKCCDMWNDFLENAKNCLLQWVFYYGKVGSMSMYGIVNTITYNSAMWAMLAAPAMIKRLGKKRFKIVVNAVQVFVILALMVTYKTSVFLIAVCFFIDRFCATTEVVDRAIESDIRDYQQYISGERVDGAFGVIQTYVGGAVGAVTNLFIPWVYQKNGFDGTDYNVLNVYDDKGRYNQGNVLYKLLDVLLKVSLAGSIIDIVPWLFYNLSETQQKAIIKVITIRSAAEDKSAGSVEDRLYCEACEAVRESFDLANEEPVDCDAIKDRRQKKAARAHNGELEIAAFVREELDRYHTEYGQAALELSRLIVSGTAEKFYENYDAILAAATALPAGANKRERNLRKNAVSNARAVKSSKRLIEKYYPNGLQEYSGTQYEEACELPEETKEQRKAKRKAISEANRSRKIYGRATKPYLVAMRDLILYDAYEDPSAFTADYDGAKERLAAIGQ